jgi:hypothetical protein
LELEKLTSYLSKDDAEIAAPLFASVRGDPVTELKSLLASVRQTLDRECAATEQKDMAFAEAENDIFKYEALVGDLDDDEIKEDVRAILRLTRCDFKDHRQAAERLYGIFSTQKATHKAQRA